MKNMEQVLSRFRDLKLKLKPCKCELLKRDIFFLCHKVNREWVSTVKGSYNGGTTISFSEGGWWICIEYCCFR